MKMTCQKFFVPNKDPHKCKKGDTFNVKSRGGKPLTFCNRNKPTDSFPVLSDGKLKMWYTAGRSKGYPRKGFSCTTICNMVE